MFRYNSYWRTWDRVLGSSTSRRGVVEVNLTPIGGKWDTNVAPIIIREHFTSDHPGDRRTNELPAEVRELMVENLGEELTARLISEDFMSQIDFEVLRRISNGGAKFEDIKLHCLEQGEKCEGAVRYRMALSGTGKAFPRCEYHWDRRLEEQERITRRYGPGLQSDFDPMYAGERYEEDEW